MTTICLDCLDWTRRLKHLSATQTGPEIDALLDMHLDGDLWEDLRCIADEHQIASAMYQILVRSQGYHRNFCKEEIS